MKKINEILDDDRKIEPRISKRFNKMCMDWAFEAYKLDSSHSIEYYYNLFIKRAKTKYFREVFKDDESIET